MTLNVKGTITYNPDVKPSEPKYIIECKSPAICMGGSGILEEMIQELVESVRCEIHKEFGADSFIELTRYKMNFSFDVRGIINKTLDEYTDAAAKTKEAAP